MKNNTQWWRNIMIKFLMWTTVATWVLSGLFVLIVVRYAKNKGEW